MILRGSVTLHSLIEVMTSPMPMPSSTSSLRPSPDPSLLALLFIEASLPQHFLSLSVLSDSNIFLWYRLPYLMFLGSTFVLDPASLSWNWYLLTLPYGAVPTNDIPKLRSKHLLSYFIRSPRRPRLTLPCQIQTWASYFLVYARLGENRLECPCLIARLRST